MNENLKYFAGAVAVVGLSVGAVLYRSSRRAPVVPEKPVAAIPAKPAVPDEPAIKHPLPDSQAQVPLPSLDESDAPMQNELGGLIGKESVERFFIPDSMIRHIVVTIDNLPTEKVAERIRPVKPTPGKFAVGGPEEAPVLDPANYQRYEPVVQLIRSVDTQSLIASYKRYYPLYQDAYENLGHPPEYFNDRVVEVIDHLLATPDIKDPIALTQPGVLYEYADPALESRSAGQKALIRMGSDNAKIVKDKLRELRSALIAQRP
jgi:hypothetical protein